MVARDEGYFRDEGLDVDVKVTPGSGQHNSDDRALKDDIFKRGLEATYDIVLYSEFASRAALDAYQNHPEHVKIKPFFGAVREARQCMDYEV